MPPAGVRRANPARARILDLCLLLLATLSSSPEKVREVGNVESLMILLPDELKALEELLHWSTFAHTKLAAGRGYEVSGVEIRALKLAILRLKDLLRVTSRHT
jgi:hypothetical protein